jgi:hypothetical protein
MNWNIQDYQARALLDDLSMVCEKLGQVERRLRRVGDQDSVRQADALSDLLDEIANACACTGIIGKD